MEKPLTISDEQIKTIGKLLFEQVQQERVDIRNAQTKHILTLLAKTGAIALALVAPKSALVTKELFKNKEDYKSWKQFDERLLKQNLKRLARQKIIEITEKKGRQIIKIAEKGKLKVLSYSIHSLSITKQKRWDGKWRLVLYDIPVKQNRKDKIIKNTLRRLGFLKIQNSVYLLPYPCLDEIEFLRHYYSLGRYIKYFIVNKIEDQEEYKSYFGL